MNASTSLPRRKMFGRLSIVVGNIVQIAGIAAAFAALALARSHSEAPIFAAVMMIAAWLLIYFFCHGIAHWIVGRLFGIRFAFYTVGGTSNPEGYPTGIRWVFEHLPFFGGQTTKASMQKATARQGGHVVGGSNVLGSISDTDCRLRLESRYSREQAISGLRGVLGNRNAVQQLENPTGDYSKARRALRT